MAKENPFRVGIVGAGHISEFHVRAVERTGVAQVMAVADLARTRACDLATKFHIPASFGTMEEMIRSGIDVVHILTPPETHAALAIQSLQLGCHVLVEKPLAVSVEEADQVIAASQLAGKVVCVNHSLLYDRFVRKALSVVRRGGIGTPLTFDYFRSSDYPPYLGGELPVHFRNGGYPFLDQGIHAMYLAEAFLGVMDDTKGYFITSGADTNLLFDEWRVVARSAQGATANIQISWNIRPMQSWFVVQGTKGVLRVNLFGMWVDHRRQIGAPKAAERAFHAMAEGIAICAQVPTNIVRFAVGKIVQYDGLHALVKSFYRSLKRGEPAPVHPAQARSAVYWTERIAHEGDSAKLRFVARFQSDQRAKILVTGANGLIGRHLVQRFIQQRTPIRIFVRREPPAEIVANPGVEVVLGDLGDPAAVDRAVRGAEIVYHVGATMNGSAADHVRGTVCGTQNIIESVLRYRVKRLLYVSSLSCLHASAAVDGQSVTEAWPVELFPQKRGLYTQSKTAAENIVRAAVANRELAALIVRPGRVFGPGVDLSTPEVAQKRRNTFFVLGDGNRALPLVYVDDLVDALLLASEKCAFDGTILHIVDPAVITQNQLVDEFLLPGSPDATAIHIPTSLLYALAFGLDVMGKLLNRNMPISVYKLKSGLAHLRFDCSHAFDQIGWQPRIGIWEGLKKGKNSTPASAVLPRLQPAEVDIALQNNGLTPLVAELSGSASEVCSQKLV